PVPPNGIPADCQVITPSMLTLVQLTTAEIERIVAAVPGGAANIQDIYPLAPLQEGILFHYLLEKERDPYLLVSTLSFDSRERLDRFVQVLQQVVDRHDVLRTAVVWEGLTEPVQVVWRRALIEVQALELSASAHSDALAQLEARINPDHHRLDIRHAPMLKGFAAFDTREQRWLLRLVYHHLAADNATVGLMLQEIALIEAGRAAALPVSVPFRNFVAQ